jgi:hypothetical protein
MTKEDLVKYMLDLAQVRPVFHSEDDFKFELGFLLGKKYDYVRLERPFYLNDNSKIELDIEIDGKIAIELKYKKALFKQKIKDEWFDLSKDGQVTYSRYDIVKDAWRVKSLIEEKRHSLGFTIVLVNAREYWSSVKASNKDKQFELTENRKFNKGEKLILSGTKNKKRRDLIKINFNDEINWIDYSTEEGKNGTFRFLVMDVNDLTH